MVHFHGICHENCVLRYVEEVLEFRKSDFMGLKGQFDVKTTNFRGVIVKICHYRPILATRTHLRPIFMMHVLYFVHSLCLSPDTGEIQIILN